MGPATMVMTGNEGVVVPSEVVLQKAGAGIEEGGDNNQWVLQACDKAMASLLDPNDPIILHLMDLLIDEAQEIYLRGLISRALGAVCLKVKGVKGKIRKSEQWGALIDALLDLIGLCNDRSLLYASFESQIKLTDGDRERIKRNACVTLALLMDEEEQLQETALPAKSTTKASANKNATTRSTTSASRPSAAPPPSGPPQPSSSTAADDANLLAQWHDLRMGPTPARVIAKKKQTSIPPATSTATRAATTMPPPSLSRKPSGGSIKKLDRTITGEDKGLPTSASTTSSSSFSCSSMKDLIRHVKTITPRKREGSRANSGSGKDLNRLHEVTEKNIKGQGLIGKKRPLAAPLRERFQAPKPSLSSTGHGISGGMTMMSSGSVNPAVTEPLDLLSISQFSSTTDPEHFLASTLSHDRGGRTSPTKKATATSTAAVAGEGGGGQKKTISSPSRGRRTISSSNYALSSTTSHRLSSKATWRPRPAVLFADQVAKDPSWTPNTRDDDLFEKDRKLGYQVPRLWFSSKAAADASQQIISLPDKRPEPLDQARKGLSSKAYEEEYHRVMTYHNYRAIHTLSEADPEFKRHFAKPTWEALVQVFEHNEHIHRFESEWTPRRGNVQERFTWRRKDMEQEQEDEGESGIVFEENNKGLPTTTRPRSSRMWTTLGRRRSSTPPPTFSTRMHPSTGAITTGSIRPRTASPTRRRSHTPTLITLDQAHSLLRHTAAVDQTSFGSPPKTAEPKKRLHSVFTMEGDEIRVAQEAKAELKKLRLESVFNAVAAASAPSTSPWPAIREEQLVDRGEGMLQEKDVLMGLAKREAALVHQVIDDELQAVTEDEQHLQRRLFDRIQAERSRMFWVMHMQFEGGALMIKARLVRALDLWARGFEKSQMALALGIWRVRTDTIKFVSETRKYHVIAGRDKFLTALRRLIMKRKYAAMEKWIYKVAWAIWEERNAMAIKIQCHYWRWRAYRHFIILHETRHINGPLADVYLDRPRKGLRFYITPKIRHDRRRIWLATVTIQKEYRKRDQRRRYLRFRRSLVRLQAQVRMWSDHRAYLYLRLMAIRIQAKGRTLLATWKFKLWRQKAHVIQKLARAHLGRIKYYQRKYLPRNRAEKTNVSALRIQRLYRGYRGRKAVVTRKEYLKHRWRAALRIQVGWYQYKNLFPCFLLLSALRVQDRREHELDETAYLRYRICCARKIQRVYRRCRHYHRESAAVRLQCWGRGLMGYDLVSILRKERWASRKIRHWGISMMRKRNRASLTIAFWWLSLKPGRLLRHLEIWSRKQEEAEEMEERRRRYDAASKIQAVVHGVWTRREFRQIKAAIQIQRIVRGFLGHRRAWHTFCKKQHIQATKYINKIIHAARIKETARISRLRHLSTIHIQKRCRGHWTRAHLIHTRAVAAKRQAMISKIQRAYRAHVRMMVAMECFESRRREFQNPLRLLTSVAVVVRRSLRHGLKGYHPEDEQIGMRLASWTRRIGASDVLPLLKAAKIDALEQLLRQRPDEKRLRLWGVEERVLRGGGGSQKLGIHDAETVRKTILAMLTAMEVPLRLQPKRLREVYDGFRVIEDRSIIKRLFTQAYGSALASRAEAFAQGVESVTAPVTSSLLRRFFKLHSSATKVKEHQDEVAIFPEGEAEAEWNYQRTAKAAEYLDQGVERLCGLLPSYMALATKLQDLHSRYGGHLKKQKFEDLKRRFIRTRPGVEPESREAARERNRQILANICLESYQALDHLSEMIWASRIIQREYRSFTRRRAEALARHQAAVYKIYGDYMDERGTNYVRIEWESDRRKEAAEMEQKMNEEMIVRERWMVEVTLKHILPFGWAREWQQGEQQNQDDGHYVYRLTKDSKVIQEQTARPYYTYDDDRATIKIQSAMKVLVAKKTLYRLRRAKRQKQMEEAGQRVWETKEKERNQAVTVRLTVNQTLGTADALLAQQQEAILLRDQEALRELEDKIASAVDSDAEIRIGMPVHARYGGLAYYYPGTIYQVNPTQYSIPDGLKWYPKGTFGILYDDGDTDPAVSLSMIRVLRLKVGMKIWARYASGETFYPGRIAGIVEREGVVLSYKIHYDDGEEERNVRRSFIHVDEKEASMINARLEEAGQQYEEGKKWRLWRMDRLTRKEEGKKKQGEKQGEGLGKEAVVVKSIGIRLRIEYTRMKLPFGWVKKIDPSDDQAFYEHVSTGQKKRKTPSYTYKDDLSVRRIQTAWRGFIGKRAILKILLEENPGTLAITTIKEASKKAWVGYEEEGITLEMWLNRLGLSHVYAALAKPAAAGDKGHGPKGKATSTAASSLHKSLFTLERLKRLDDRGLASLGISNEKDRRLVLQMVEKEPKILESFRFINYYTSPNDPRSLIQCIADSRSKINDLLLKAYPGSNIRVEKMSEAVVHSAFPITYAQMSYFISKYAGKTATAQEHVMTELVNLRTTSTVADEKMAYEIYRKGAARLVTLLSNMSIISLRDTIIKALEESTALVGGDVDCRDSKGKVGKASGLVAVVKNALGGRLMGESKPAAPASMAASTTLGATTLAASSSSALPANTISGPEGKASYLLRVKAFEKVLHYAKAAILVQTKYRGHKAKASLKRILAARLHFIVLNQSLCRRYKVRCLRLALLSQQTADWEQLWSQQKSCFYYYNKRSGESVWQEPWEPYRPLVRDKYSGKLIQAWPHLDIPPPVAKKASRGKCMNCFTKEADRRCNTCFQEKTAQDWNRGYAYYCFGCYADLHKDEPAMREHGFTVVKSVKPRVLTCGVCGELASRRCLGIKLSEENKTKLAEVAARARTSDRRVRLDEFTRVFKGEIGIEYSNKKIEFIYQECEGNRSLAYDLWQQVNRVIDDYQELCGENFCDNCWSASHKKGQRAKHTWIGFKPGWNACVACEKEPVDRLCKDCDDELCAPCFRASHMKGRKRHHEWVTLKEALEPEEVFCNGCNRRAAASECNDCRELFCDSCSAFVHTNKCRERLPIDPGRAARRFSSTITATTNIHATHGAIEESEAGAEGGLLSSTSCVVCGQVPDTMCEQCRDVYCSEKGRDCFMKMHRRGKRQEHTRQPYTYCEELQTRIGQQKEEEEHQREAAEREEAEIKKAKDALDRRVKQSLARKQDQRQKRLKEEAEVEVRTRFAAQQAALLQLTRTK